MTEETPKLELTEDEKANYQADILREVMLEARRRIAEFNPVIKDAFFIAIMAVATPVEMMGIPAAAISPLVVTSDAHPVIQMAIYMQCMREVMTHEGEGNVPPIQKH